MKRYITCCLVLIIIVSSAYIIHINIPEEKEEKEEKEEIVNNNYVEKTEIYNIPYVAYKDREKTIIHEYDGNDIRSLKGEKIFVAFWSSYCKYCMQEFEALKKVQEEFKDMTFILISHDKSMNDLEEFLQNNPCNFYIIYNPSKAIRSKLNKEDKYIPSLYLLDKNHEIIKNTNKVLDENGIINFINN